MGSGIENRSGRGWRSLAPAAAVFVCALAACGAARPFDRAAWQADYADLKSEMERGYANLAWFGSPEGGVDLPAVDRRTSAALAAAQNDDEAIAALQAFVETLGDGHFQPIQPETAWFPPRDAERVKIDPARPAKTCEALAFAAPAPSGFSLPFQDLPGYRRLNDETSPFALAMLEGPSGRIGLVRIGGTSKAVGSSLSRAPSSAFRRRTVSSSDLTGRTPWRASRPTFRWTGTMRTPGPRSPSP